MKKVLLISLFSFSGFVCTAQILLEDKEGEKIATNAWDIPNGSFASVKLNTGDQSLGFNRYTSTKLHDPSKYRVSDFGVKAKPTEGYAAVFSNGQFSPGVNVSYSLTQVSVLADGTKGKLKPIDWGGFDVSYNVNKYLLYKKDTSFTNQVYAKIFKGFNLGLNYNLLVNQTFIISFRVGYSRKNNYDDLTSVEVKDLKSSFDSATATQRQTSVVKTAKSGTFTEYDAYPISFSITRSTATDNAKDPQSSSLKIGYTVYIKTIASPDLPKTDAGVLFFLTRQGKNGVRTPVFGVNLQAKDFFDVQKINNGLLNRIQIGFTTNISL